MGIDKTKPYQLTFSLPENVKGKEHQITVRVYDQYGGHKSKTITIFLDIPGIEDIEKISKATLSLISEEPYYKFRLETLDDDGKRIKKKLKRADLYYYDKDDKEKNYWFAAGLNSPDPAYFYEIEWSEKPEPGSYYAFARVIDENNHVTTSNEVLLSH